MRFWNNFATIPKILVGETKRHFGPPQDFFGKDRHICAGSTQTEKLGLEPTRIAFAALVRAPGHAAGPRPEGEESRFFGCGFRPGHPEGLAQEEAGRGPDILVQVLRPEIHGFRFEGLHLSGGGRLGGPFSLSSGAQPGQDAGHHHQEARRPGGAADDTLLAKLKLNLEAVHPPLGGFGDFLLEAARDCPHEVFLDPVRPSRAGAGLGLQGTYIARKENAAVRMARFALRASPNNRLRHETLQRFMLHNDSVTVATEVPVWLRA